MKAPNSNHFTGKKRFQTPRRNFGKKKKGHITTNMPDFQEVKENGKISVYVNTFK